MSVKHTRHSLTFQPGDQYDGENWPIATVTFSSMGFPVAEYIITTDHVHASELVQGEPGADMRLWCAAPNLLAACEAVLNSDMAMREEDEGRSSAILSIVRAAIAKATGS